MEIKTLYRYEREDGGIDISPKQPVGEYTTLYRLIADEGTELVKGDIRTCCVDTDTTEGWTEEPIDDDDITADELVEMIRGEME